MPLKILHLEDNPLDAELIAADLESGGFDCQIRRVETRADFLAAVDEQCFEIILADYSLPMFDGVTALKIALEKCPEVPFIIISGAIGEELAVETLKAGATDYILKHRLERLVPSVRRALRETTERDARRRAEREREDLLEREQQARQKAEEANRLKDEFLATVSHELRTPLNAIYGWSKILRSGNLQPEAAANAVEIIERNAKAQIQLVEDLLDVSRMISGKMRLETQTVEPELIIRSAIDTVRPAAQAKSIHIETEFDRRTRTVSADPNRLQQIIWNLLSNAVKFTPHGGRVSIRLTALENEIEIQISDTGEGIAPEFLPHVFDRFRQAAQATTRQHGGLGLGLAIVKNLVEMHGGRIWAESEGAGRGSTFTVRLPQTSNKQAENKIADEKPANGILPLSGLRVLAVEDDLDSRELLRILLEQNGAAVVTAENASEAVKKLQIEKPDVLVSDVGMPVEDGYSMMRRIRALETNGGVPAIALTGFARQEDADKAHRAGFNSHVSKPIEPDKLVREIAALIKK